MKRAIMIMKKNEKKNEKMSNTEKLLIDIEEAIKKAKKED